MIRWLLLPLLCAALLASDADVRKQLEAAYERATRAVLQAKTVEDLDAAHASFDTTDWVSVGTRGDRMTWDELRKYGAEILKSRPGNMRNEIVELTVNTDTAVALVHVKVTRVRADGQGEYGPAGLEHEIVSGAVVRDTFVRTPAGWRRKLHEKLEERVFTVDGKPHERRPRQ
ncbi:MAG: hypothetical protein HYS04_10310 [Acidobacteria bacterium]|nr:hypothetical protein [Acidobacteriota bacterium]